MSQKEMATYELNGHTHSKATHNSKSNSLIERERVEGTPFMAIKQDEMWFLSWGNYKMTENRPTKEEAVKLLETNLWDVISVYVLSVLNESDNVRKKMEEMATKGQ